MKAEYRIVCARFPEPGHGLHHQEKEDHRTAVTSVVGRNAKAAVQQFYYFCSREAPYKVQTREVSEWEDS